MKIKDLRTKSVAELDKELAKTRKKLADLRKDKVTKDVKPTQISEARREVAQIMTIRNETAKTGEKNA